ncbi:unnamed protein product, partial [marine sediment metagenome]
GIYMVNLEFLWMGVVELAVAGLLYATAGKTRSSKIRMFMYIGMTVLIVLAGYQLINAFG